MPIFRVFGRFQDEEMVKFEPKLMKIGRISKKSYLRCSKLSFNIPNGYEWLHIVTTDTKECVLPRFRVFGGFQDGKMVKFEQKLMINWPDI